MNKILLINDSCYRKSALQNIENQMITPPFIKKIPFKKLG